ncbi:MAG: DUF2110 family protein [Candidatus Bathyarchaeota archaeon]|nr:DUF2110 family protein [Candidatus Bathyarchaeota archaeon]
MITAVLASKIYSENQLAIVEEHLKTLFEGLKVKVEKIEIAAENRIRTIFSGEDEKAALRLIEKEIGLSPTRIEDFKKFSTVKGYINNLDKSRDEVSVDIGVAYPKTLNAIIPLQRLQAQLAGGRKIALQKIAELYSLSDNMPIIVKITNLSEKNIEAELAETQLATYKRWVKSVFDRILILGASIQEVRKAIKHARCQNDLITVEPLGLFEHAVVCKLGTDAVGLIPKLGKHLQGAKLEAFKPKTLIEFFKTSILSNENPSM